MILVVWWFFWLVWRFCLFFSLPVVSLCSTNQHRNQTPVICCVRLWYAWSSTDSSAGSHPVLVLMGRVQMAGSFFVVVLGALALVYGRTYTGVSLSISYLVKKDIMSLFYSSLAVSTCLPYNASYTYISTTEYILLRTNSENTEARDNAP
jgi:hypothetical protein